MQALAKERNLNAKGSLWCGSIEDWALVYNEETAGNVVESALADVGSTWKEPGRVKELAEGTSKDRNMKGQQLCLAVAAAQDILHNCSISKAKVQMLAPELLNSCFHSLSGQLTLKDSLAARIDKKSKKSGGLFTPLQLSSERHLRLLIKKCSQNHQRQFHCLLDRSTANPDLDPEVLEVCGKSDVGAVANSANHINR